MSAPARAAARPSVLAVRARAYRYCSPLCRQKAYPLRHAQATIDAGEAEPPTVLHETVRQVVPPGATAREWLHLLSELTFQLEGMACEHKSAGSAEICVVFWSSLLLSPSLCS